MEFPHLLKKLVKPMKPLLKDTRKDLMKLSINKISF